MENLTIHLDSFEGPLDLLYHLIEKNEIDIYDIPIVTITDQYLAFLEQAENKNMESMSAFLLMAATLLEIKSKMLLPARKNKEQEQADPREELVARLLEYKKFKQVTETLKRREEGASLYLFKKTGVSIRSLQKQQEDTLEELLEGITMEDIFRAFEEVMKRRENKVDTVRSGFRSVERDLYTIEEKIEYISDLLQLHPKVSFQRIFRRSARKMEIVVTFLALLELIKRKYVHIRQEDLFSDIEIMLYGGTRENETDRTGSGD